MFLQNLVKLDAFFELIEWKCFIGSMGIAIRQTQANEQRVPF